VIQRGTGRWVLFGALSLALLAAIGVVVVKGTVLQAPPVSRASALTLPSITPSAEPNRIEALQSELVRVTEYEKTNGCVTTSRFGQPELCGESKRRVDALHEELVAALRALEQRDPQAIAEVTARIRQLTNDPQRTMTFQGSSTNPYTSSGKRIEQYRDTQGFEYWVNPIGNIVVQFGPGPNAPIRFAESGTLTTADLRQRAEDFLTANVSEFTVLRSEFVLRELTASSRYSFRLESRTTPPGERLPPFVQVVLSPVGELMSFSDTRSLY
jgi:hypothetical protein